MKMKFFIILILLILGGCSSRSQRGTIAELQQQKVDLSAVEITDGLEQAMASYQQFLQSSDNVSALTPEAIRRLADLKVEKEYGLVDSDPVENSPVTLPPPEKSEAVVVSAAETEMTQPVPNEIESDQHFEQRTTQNQPVASAESPDLEADFAGDDLDKAGPREAITLYQKLLDEYPLYQRNDQVLYQMSRAYEELGQIEEAMVVLARLVREYPESRYIDEVQFRRAENLFTHRQYLDAEEAYSSIVSLGVGSKFYQLALYKLGWTFYKQELYEDALQKFIALLDYKVDIGYDFEQSDDPLERKRIEDTFRVISLSFSYLGGADATADFFAAYGHRDFESNVYENLANYFFNKRRYSDAVATYSKFIELNSFHKKAPLFALSIIDINIAGGFPSLVIEAKKSFANDYGVTSNYWQHFEQAERPEVIAGLKQNLTDLANHYHALYQNPKLKKEQDGNFSEATHWYRQFLSSFPVEAEAPTINYQLADLLLENRSYADAAVEYEKTSYGYEPHEQSSKAGYAAVYSYRQHLEATMGEDAQPAVKREVIRSSLRFAETYPEHEKADIVLGAAADDLYALKDYEHALYAALDVIDYFPNADLNVSRSAWLVIGHSTYELELYAPSETAYLKVLELTEDTSEKRDELIDNLAAAIYRQGEEANAVEDFSNAAKHFLRVATLAPTSTIRPTSEYDAATAFIQLKDWTQSAAVLTAFRSNFPTDQRQAEVTKKLAYVYREDEKFALAAEEFEQIERESDDQAVRSEALLLAAELYRKAELIDQTLIVYQRYIDYFPQPLAIYIETCQKISDIFKQQQRQADYLAMLKRIIAIDAGAGDERTDRTMFLAARAGLVLAELNYLKFTDMALNVPFAKNLKKKQQSMKALIREFSGLIEYQVGEVTAASTFYLAEIYADFSRSLMESERPKDLDAVDLEDYEMALEDQAYPFEEKAIGVHQSNLELIAMGVYNSWVEKSIERLAQFLPARYAKYEEPCPLVTELDTYLYELDVVIDPDVAGPVEINPESSDEQIDDSVAESVVEESVEVTE